MPTAPPDHKPPGFEFTAPRAPWTRGPTKRATGSTRQWRNTRARIFKRDLYTCQHCRLVGRGMECDHVIPVAEGGSDDETNLQTLCPTCHRLKTEREAMRALERQRHETNAR